MSKDWDEIRRASEQQGWRWTRTKRGHWQGYAPDGRTIVTVGGTPSDRRALDNALARMRRAGFRG